jgi:hypothetical protein
LLVLHVPDGTVFARVIIDPVHTDEGPVIAAGAVITVTIMFAAVPQPVLYLIVAFPAAIAVTIPEVEPTVALPVFKLVHVP